MGGEAAQVILAPILEKRRHAAVLYERPYAAAKAGAKRRRRDRAQRSGRSRESDCLGNLVPEQLLGGGLRLIDQRAEPLEISSEERRRGCRHDDVALDME